MEIYSLHCESSITPINIDINNPVFSWQLKGAGENLSQTAFRIQCSSSSNFIKVDYWDSGKIKTDNSIFIKYDGKELLSMQKIYWRVKVWDENNKESDWSEISFFETAFLSRSDWKAKWISGSLTGSKHSQVPVPYLKNDFTLKKEIKQGKLFITALGIYEPYINGERIGSDVFSPGWTDYSRRVNYQVFDVTSTLNRGDNTIGVILGDGWYCGHIAWGKRQHYGLKPELLAQIHIDFNDGSSQTIITDENWKHSYGPIIESDFIMGESYDARLEFDGWNNIDFKSDYWSRVSVQNKKNIFLKALPYVPVSAMQKITPVSVFKASDDWLGNTQWIFDFGQNMLGRVRLKISGKWGKTIILRFAEVLDEKGEPYFDNLRTAKATDYYTLKGDENGEIYESHFTFHGFRYALVSGLTKNPEADMLTGIVLHSNMKMTGSFECSNKLINKLQHNIQWGQRGNFLSVPTDCPQRDERLGWMGDAQVFAGTAAFNMDVASFFNKWQIDIADCENKNPGYFSPIAPFIPLHSVLEKDGHAGWSDAGIICPWTIYQSYGDKRILENHYESFKRYIDTLETNSVGLICEHPSKGFQGFKDWLNQEQDKTPGDLIGTAYFAYSTKILAKIAVVLNNQTDVEKYNTLHKKIKEVFNNQYVSKDGNVIGETQTAYVLALYFDLLSRPHADIAIEKLVENIKSHGIQIATGFLGTPYIMHVLSKYSCDDIAGKLLLQEKWPSWLYAVTKGATTIWERWDGWTHDNGFADKDMNSFNHYAYGAMGEWLYKHVAGIDFDENYPAYKKIIIKPHIVANLTHVNCSFKSVYGFISVKWQVKDNQFYIDVEIPANTTAELRIPNMESKMVGSGEYNFISHL
ncbi:family 78 glycoside hydrolase catalytic domain [bacterium]|nr:family 78 glycoside hydrolase catalytic domain [bacterium]